MITCRISWSGLNWLKGQWINYASTQSLERETLLLARREARNKRHYWDFRSAVRMTTFSCPSSCHTLLISTFKVLMENQSLAVHTRVFSRAQRSRSCAQPAEMA